MTLNSFQSPYVGVWLSVLIGSVICCAYIGSVVAFNAILSSAAIAVMMSYGMPIFVRVIWPESLPQAEQGPFRLGKYAWPVNLLSFAFTVFVCILFILPTAVPVNSLNMNYAVVAIGGLLLFTILAWAFYGRLHFKGPRRTADETEPDPSEINSKLESPIIKQE